MPRTVRFGEGNVGRTAETKAQVYVDNVAEDPRSLSFDWARETGIVRLLSVPILAGDDLLGVLSVRSRHGGLSTDENRALATSFAVRAAVAMQHARTYAEAVRRAGRLRDLVAVSHSITESLDSTDVMQRIAHAAAAMTPGALAAVHVFDPATQMLHARGLSDGDWEGIPADHAAGAGLPGLVVETRAPVLIPQPVSHPRTMVPQWWRRRPTATYYGLPINLGETFVGVLDYILPEGLPDAEEQEALRLLAAQAGIAIRNAGLYQGERVQAERIRTLYDEARRRRDVAESLARVARELTGTLEEGRIAELFARDVVDLLRARGATLYRYEAETGRLISLHNHGPQAEVTRGLVLEPGEAVAGRAVADRKILVTPDILREPRIRLSPALRARLERARGGAVVSVPLVAHDRVVGALSLSDVAGREFTADELQALQVFADQAALALENARLYESAQDALVRLRDTQAQLVQAAKMSAVGQLVSGVAHELNNPLSVIIGYGQVLLGREVPAAVKRPLELIVAQGERMSKIVRNLLYVARQRPPERAAVDVRQVIEQALALRINQLTLSKIAVVTDFAADVPLTSADAQQLEQVFLNLLLNAEQAILESKPQGEITLRTRLRPDGAAIIAEVIDDGPGIPPASVSRVFEPFYTTKTVGAGTGLGLSVSYGIVQEHGGRLSVESEPGRTVFTLELPVVVPPPPEPVETERRVVSGIGKVALVVEDEADVLDLIVTLLGERGWRVDVAAGGRAAFDRLRQHAYDLIVSDMRMPDGHGEELYRNALAHRADYGRRFIFITGDTATEQAWSFLEGTDVPVVEKPFQPKTFEAAVYRVVAADASA
jgi:signal transduction histidine kinase/ActR/RegA family two-component response regulator